MTTIVNAPFSSSTLGALDPAVLNSEFVSQPVNRSTRITCFGRSLTSDPAVLNSEFVSQPINKKSLGLCVMAVAAPRLLPIICKRPGGSEKNGNIDYVGTHKSFRKTAIQPNEETDGRAMQEVFVAGGPDLQGRKNGYLAGMLSWMTNKFEGANKSICTFHHGVV
eukprot:scaffold26340_cov103-Cylindrotheca_fusiformis.AAC.1